MWFVVTMLVLGFIAMAGVVASWVLLAAKHPEKCEYYE